MGSLLRPPVWSTANEDDSGQKLNSVNDKSPVSPSSGSNALKCGWYKHYWSKGGSHYQDREGVQFSLQHRDHDVRKGEQEGKVGVGRDVIMTINGGNRDTISRVTRAEEWSNDGPGREQILLVRDSMISPPQLHYQWGVTFETFHNLINLLLPLWYSGFTFSYIGNKGFSCSLRSFLALNTSLTHWCRYTYWHCKEFFKKSFWEIL